MFDQLFKAQRARERHLNAPLVDERIRYLSHWAAQGSIRSSLRVRAQDLLAIIEYLDLKTSGDIDEEQINKAADRWATRQPQPPNVIDFRYGKLRFISHARQWIAFLGRLLRAGVDINTIRAWLGHVSIDTTNIYAETDLEMKAKALATCEVKETKRSRR
jgi:integrase